MIAHAVDRDKLLADHLPLVAQVARSLLRGRAYAGVTLEEACAAGRVGLWRASERFISAAGQESFERFAAPCVRNAIRDELRKAARRTRGELPLAIEAPADDEQASPLDLMALEEALASASPEDRELLTLRFGLDGQPALTMVEVGRRLGLSKSATVVRVHAALERMRQALG